MKEKVHEDDRKAAITASVIYYAKLNDNILWIHALLNEGQRSVSDL